MLQNKLLFIICTSFILGLCPLTLIAQGVAINADGSSANSSAMLDVKSTNSGMLIPRMTQANRNALSSPATSLIIFQTDDTPGYYYNSGTPASPEWERLATGSDLGFVDGSGVATRVAFWQDANTLSSSANLYWNNTSGRLGVGTSSPTAKVHITAPSSGSTLKVGRLSGQPSIEGTDSWMMIEQSGANPLALNYYGSNDVVLVNGGGNVGIGTTSPSSKLHVNGTVRFQGLGTGTQTTSLMIDANGNVTGRTLNIANWDDAYSWGDHAAEGYLTSFSEIDPTWNGSANQTGAIGRTGNVGIGTTSPNTKLHVNGVSTLGDGTVSSPASTSTLLIPASGTAGTQRTYIELMGVYANDATNENGGGFIKFRTSTAANYGPEIGGIRRSGGTGDFLIKTGGSSPQERLRVFDNGTVQISNLSGTGTSIVFADANGNLSVGTGSSLFSAGNGLSWSETTLNSVWTESGNNIYNNNTGNVGIGTNAPQYKTDIVGGTSSNTALRLRTNGTAT
ncbi:MAG: hypothetical protein PHW82_17255, partial [Bacteroidales bacterium]|nr:hypothetical protein [Bacteroidales bacterium]